MTRDEALERLRSARVGRLATVRPDGTPHVIPFVFAAIEDGDDLTVYWAVDDKPKERTNIQRLENIRANPAVEFVVDGYDEDWSRLWWVRVRGRATLVDDPMERRRALGALRHRYARYTVSSPRHAVVRIAVTGLSTWSASDPAQQSTRS
jgi:PPOX class probable F420-dependent enzyme